MKGKTFLALLLTLSLLLANTNAKVNLSPETKKVRKTNWSSLCPTACVINNDVNSWCFVTSNPSLLEMGWDVVQVFGTETYNSVSERYWQVRVRPFG
jgi:hypothetical protein